MNVRELFATLGLDVDEQSFAVGQLAADGVKKALDLAVAAVEKLASAFVSSVTSTAAYSEHLDQLAQRTGLSTQSLQELGFAAETNGSSLDSMAHALQLLSRSAFDANKGGKESAESFAKLGVKIRDARGQLRPTEDLFLDLADRFADMPAGVEKTALAMKVFGRSGAELIPLLNHGADGLQELRDTAHELGLVLDEDAIARGARLQSVIEQLHVLVRGLGQVLAENLLGPLAEVGERFLEWYKANQALIRQRIGQIVTLIGKAVLFLADVVAKAVHVIGVFLDHLKLFALIAGGIALAAIVANASAIGAWILSMVVAGATAVATGLAAAASWLAAAAPVIALAILFAGLLLVIEDVYQFLTGGDSLIGDLGPKWSKFIDDFTKPHAGDPWWLAALRYALRLVTDLQVELPRLIDQFVNLVPRIISTATAVAPMLAMGGAGTAAAVIGGGAANPIAAAAATLGPRVNVLAPQTSAQITVNAGSAETGASIADKLADRLDDHHQKVMREAAAAVNQ